MTILKITHMPIVAIIYVFEIIHNKIKGDAPLFSALGPAGANTLSVDGASSLRRQKPFLSDRAKTYSQHFPETLSENGTNGAGPQSLEVRGKNNGRVEMVVGDNPGLEQRVEDLSAKIAELTALLMAQQGTANAEE